MERLIELVVAGTVPDLTYRTAITGDLLEEYRAIRAVRGALVASVWAWRQLIGSLPWFSALAREGDRGCLTFLDAARFYAVLTLILALGLGLVEAFLLIALRGAGWSSGIPALGAAVLLSAAAGFVAARLARRAPLIAALGVGVLGLAIGVGGVLLGHVGKPAGFWAPALVLVVPAAFAGGMLRVRRIAS